MHCPRLEFNDHEFDENFESIFALLQDEKLQSHAIKYPESQGILESLVKVWSFNDEHIK